MVDAGLTFRVIRGIFFEMRISLIWSREVGKVAIMKLFFTGELCLSASAGRLF